MLKAILIDGNAIARDLLTTILANGSYDVVGSVNTGAKAVAVALKHTPHIVCINDEQLYDTGIDFMTEMRAVAPKALIFMVSSELDAASLQKAVNRGVQGFIVKPFNATNVLNTIRKTALTLVKKQQKAAAAASDSAE
ncbi:MAG TPA: response regulator [Burkholderiaceae bacterium]